MRKYPSKIGIGLSVFILLILLGSSTLMINNQEWVGFGINILVLAFIAYTFMTTSYTVDNEILKIKCGFFFNKSIAISSIYEIRESRNPISAPAASLDRLELFYDQNKSVLVSPREKQEFIDHLLQLNSKIEFKTQ